MPLVDMEKPDVDVFLTEVLDDEYGLSEGTIRNYRKALRAFFGYLDREWHEDVAVGAAITRKVDPEECLDDTEVEAMLDATRNAREKALIAVLDDTGMRIGAVLSIQMQHVDIEGERATLTVNPDAHTKGDKGAKPLTWSRGYVANWLDVHPRPDRPTAALFHKRQKFDDEEDGALERNYAGRIVKSIAEDAGLDRDRVTSKLFRASAVTRWIREDLGEQAIKHRTGWSEDSRMFQVYSHVTDKQMNDVVFDHYDIDGEDSESPRPDLEQCPQCRTPLRGGERFCPGCASPLTASAEEATEEVDDDFFVSFNGAASYDEDAVAEARRRFKTDPEFRSMVVLAREMVDHESPSS
jgi:integrase